MTTPTPSPAPARVRVLVADDEAIARDGLCALLAADPEVEVVAQCADGAQAVKALREMHPDVAFLDVQMPALDGFAVLRHIEDDHIPTIVFVTAYDRYALRAFDAHAVDYLLKPFENERFRLALARAKERARSVALGDSADRGLLRSLTPPSGSRCVRKDSDKGRCGPAG